MKNRNAKRRLARERAAGPAKPVRFNAHNSSNKPLQRLRAALAVIEAGLSFRAAAGA